ncbi:MAG: hypothetical protein WDM91_00095 [Rhizomicrobium sp.]
MISPKTLLACTFFVMLAGAAQAQEINTFASADAGTEARVDRLRAFGDSYKQTWTPTNNFNCSDITLGSNTGPSPNDVYDASGAMLPPRAADAPQNAVVQQDPLQTTVVTGVINDLCFARP